MVAKVVGKRSRRIAVDGGLSTGPCSYFAAGVLEVFEPDYARALLDSADNLALELGLDGFDVLFGDYDGHADAHVENLVHLRGIGSAALLDVTENGRHLPALRVDRRVQGLGENSGQVVYQATASDVGEALHQAVGQ